MTDVKLDQVDGTFVVLEARVVKAAASDFMLDSPQRHQGGGPNRRALVHDQKDGLTVNFNGDYPGGVTVTGPVHLAEIVPQQKQGQVLTLVVRGGISYEVPGENIQGENITITVNVDEALNKLQAQILELNNKVAALEALLNQ